MYCAGSREIAKLSIEAVGEIDEYVSAEGVRCFHFWQLIVVRYAEIARPAGRNTLSRYILYIIYLCHCNTCVVVLIFFRLTLYYYCSLKKCIPWFEVQPFFVDLDFQVIEVGTSGTVQV